MEALKTKKLSNKKFSGLVAAVVAIASVAAFIPSYAFAVSWICQKSAECMEAAEREAAAQAKANEAQATANEYQAKVNQLEAEVANMTAQIAESEARAEELQHQIEETEAKLKEQQGILADLLIQIHFESRTDSLSILASSKTLSDYAERQNRIETLKNQINLSAGYIKEAKEKLEADKASVEEIIESQKAMRSVLATKQAEQQDLVAKYAADASAYTADAEAARAAETAAIEAYQREHPELFGGNGARVYNGYNTYPWQADCPGRADTYGTSINGRYIGGYVCECVSYVGWKAYEAYGVYLSWGNANTWDDVGRAKGIVDRTPAPKTIAQTDAGWAGHVFWVESINADGSLNVTEYNNWYATGLYTGNYHMHDFGGRVVPASEVSSYNYIHVDRL